MFQRKPLNTAITAAFGAMAAFSVNVNADSAFFPHVVVGGVVTTIVSVINTSDDLYDNLGNRIPWDKRTGQGALHWRMFYKTDVNDAPCAEFNRWLPTSVNDIQTVNLGATDLSGVMFEPGGGNGVVKYAGKNYALGTEARRLVGGDAIRGYLLVDNAESDSADNDSPERASVFGEAIVIEYESGASWGYSAFTQQDDSDLDVGEFDDEFDYEDAASASGWPVAIAPLDGDDKVDTAFMITPVIAPKTPKGKDWADSDMSEVPNKNTTYIRFSFDAEDGSEQVLFDRDETPASGAMTRSVTCVGKVHASSMFADSGVVPTDFENGGWGRLANWAVVSSGTGAAETIKEESSAVIFKLEYGTSFGPLDTLGKYNNAILIPGGTQGRGWDRQMDDTAPPAPSIL
jgi:hypothetical protein